MLSRQTVADYLLRHKFLDPAVFVSGELLIKEASRRNSVFKVISTQGPCYFIKQGTTPDTIATVAHEAVVYQYLHSHSCLDKTSFSQFLPRFHAYDATEQILVLELQRNAEDLRHYHSRNYRFSTRIASLMGTVLGTLHSLHTATHPKTLFRERVPWALTINCPPLELLREASAANIQVIKVIQDSTEFCDSIDDLRHEWHTSNLIHRDIRLDNWIVFPVCSSWRSVGLQLVDWEFATTGDACWDIGSVFGAYLSFWQSSLPITGSEPPDRFLQLSRYPLERMQPALRAFWTSYCKRVGIAKCISDRWLLKAAKYAAIRLVQTAFEQTKQTKEIAADVISLLQLSFNIMKRTAEAVTWLLGCPLNHD